MPSCKPFGSEYRVQELLNCPEDNAFKSKLRALRLRNVLDVGCGHTILLTLCYHALGIKECFAIDHWDEKHLVERLNQDSVNAGKPNPRFTSFFDVYQKDYGIDECDVIKQKLDQEQFAQHIRFRQRDCGSVLLDGETYAFLVMADILHYLDLDRSKELLIWAKRSVDAGGLLYLRFKERPACLSNFPTTYEYEKLIAICTEVLGLTGIVARRMPPYQKLKGTMEGEEVVFTNITL